jgi:hypothetical protein
VKQKKNDVEGKFDDFIYNAENWVKKITHKLKKALQKKKNC